MKNRLTIGKRVNDIELLFMMSHLYKPLPRNLHLSKVTLINQLPVS